MKYTNEYLSGLEEKDVRITFTDGCCIDIHIFDTMHLRGGDDIAGAGDSVSCRVHVLSPLFHLPSDQIILRNGDREVWLSL